MISLCPGCHAKVERTKMVAILKPAARTGETAEEQTEMLRLRLHSASTDRSKIRYRKSAEQSTAWPATDPGEQGADRPRPLGLTRPLAARHRDANVHSQDELAFLRNFLMIKDLIRLTNLDFNSFAYRQNPASPTRPRCLLPELIHLIKLVTKFGSKDYAGDHPARSSSSYMKSQLLQRRLSPSDPSSPQHP